MQQRKKNDNTDSVTLSLDYLHMSSMLGSLSVQQLSELYDQLVCERFELDEQREAALKIIRNEKSPVNEYLRNIRILSAYTSTKRLLAGMVSEVDNMRAYRKGLGKTGAVDSISVAVKIGLQNLNKKPEKP